MRYTFTDDYVIDNELDELFQFEGMEMSINENGELVAKSLYIGSSWKVKGFLGYMVDFADFKIETLAK